MGNHLHSHCTAELAVRVEKNLIFPLLTVHQWLHLVDVLGLVDADGDNFHSCFLLPFGILLVDGFQLTVAWLAPCGEETDDKRFAVVVELGCIDSLAIKSL